jgi:Schlafen, AlbA_2
MIFSLPLDQVNADRLEALRTDGVRESRHLEYKEALPGTGEDDRKEFLADVTSFANAAGGDLIYGVRGRRDSTGKSTGEIEAIVGLPDLNVGDVQLRFENMIRDGVAPRMSPVTFHPIARGTAPPCLLLRIPRGWAGLHMIIYKNWSRFYARNSAGKYQLDVNEIRAAFLAAETAYDRIRRLRTERVARSLALETPVLVGDGSKLILHAFPVNASEEVWPRVSAMQESEIGLGLPIIAGDVSTWRYNVDGFVAYTQRTDKNNQSYTQLFAMEGSRHSAEVSS